LGSVVLLCAISGALGGGQLSGSNDLPPINFSALSEALLGRIDQLVPAWLPGGVVRNSEYFVHSIWRSEKTPSLSVKMSGAKAGMWRDHGGDEQGGDLVGLYAAIHGLSMGKAAVQLAQELGLEDVAGVRKANGTVQPLASPTPPAPQVAAAKPRMSEGWTTVVPVPDFAPEPTFWHPYRNCETNKDPIDHLAKYVIDGKLAGYVVRFITSSGKKETLPYTWCLSAKDGAYKWHWKQWDDPRPLYLPGGASPLAAGGADGSVPTVVLVEGERKASILHDLLQAFMPGVYVVASWSGGCNSWPKADWLPLAGTDVLLWADCDAHRVPLTKAEREACADDAARDIAQAAKPLLPAAKQPGMKAMLGIGAMLRDTQSCKVSMLPIPEPMVVSDGWDCADAITTDGWDGARVLAFFATAQALVSDPATPIAGKKIDSPVGTESEDSDDCGTSVINGRAIPDWLAYYFDDSKKRWNTSRKMVIHILERDADLKRVLSYNELSNTVQSRTAWPWPHAPAGDVTDAVDLMLGKYLSDKYGLPSIPRAALIEAIQTVAHTRRFHPIREYLQGLEWDGKLRLDKWLIFAMGEKPAEWVDADGVTQPATLLPAMVEYLQLVGRYWVLGMIKRALEPGCKFDYCPVLEGVGGLRKSTLVELLAGGKFYSDTPFEIGHGKEAQEQVQGVWLYEIAELSNFNKAEVGAIKGFISSKVDRYRVAYGTTVGAYPRQCVLVGTTNENTYLRDRTGNRRFLPIPVRYMINTEWVQKYRDQLMAEAYHLCQQDPHLQYTPTPDQERRLFVPMQESRLQETAVVSELQHVLTRSPSATLIGAMVNELTNFVTIAQLALALGVDAAKSTAGLEAQIRGWLDHQGWKRIKKQVNGARAWGYERPVDWPPVDDVQDMSAAPTAAAAAPIEPTIQDGDDAPF
jgi:hypothetical protein